MKGSTETETGVLWELPQVAGKMLPFIVTSGIFCQCLDLHSALHTLKRGYQKKPFNLDRQIAKIIYPIHNQEEDVFGIGCIVWVGHDSVLLLFGRLECHNFKRTMLICKPEEKLHVLDYGCWTSLYEFPGTLV